MTVNILPGPNWQEEKRFLGYTCAFCEKRPVRHWEQAMHVIHELGHGYVGLCTRCSWKNKPNLWRQDFYIWRRRLFGTPLPL